MGKRGPQPKPTKLKLLHGDFIKHPERENKREPKPKEGRPKCPTYLTGHAKKEWNRIVKELCDMKVLTVAERASIEQYCDLYSRWREANDTVDKEGSYSTDGNGVVREHPAAKASRALAGLCQRWLTQFGLSPSSRAGVQVIDTAAQDEISQRFFG